MMKTTTPRLSDVVSPSAPEGANDAKWVLIKHQLDQAKVSIQYAILATEDIALLPENDNERAIAEDCEGITKAMYVDFLARYTTFLSYLSDTSVPERISRKEL